MGVTTDVKTLRETLVGEILTELAPTFAEPTKEELRALADDPANFFPARRRELYAWIRWTLNAPDWYVQRNCFAFGEKRKLVELLAKHAFPQKLEIDLTHTLRAASDDELLGLARLIGAAPLALEQGQNVDSASGDEA